MIQMECKICDLLSVFFKLFLKRNALRDKWLVLSIKDLITNKIW